MSDSITVYPVDLNTLAACGSSVPSALPSRLAANTSVCTAISWDPSAAQETVVNIGAELEKINMRMDQLDQKLELILELLETRKA